MTLGNLPPEAVGGGAQAMDETSESLPQTGDVDALIAQSTQQGIVYVDDMSYEIEVGNGEERRRVVLDHSFHEMRSTERQLRRQCGISVSKSSATGMNIAIMQLRMLFVDADGKVYQIGVAFADKLGRDLLLCSTGGVVMTDVNEIGRLKALADDNAASPAELMVLKELKARQDGKDKLVRCCAADADDEDAAKMFALCGAYSFFDPKDDEERLNERATAYKLHHDGAYRQAVGGSDHDQLFHHSEQTGFKALLENTNILARVVRFARKNGMLPGGRLSLEALSIDIFTTRSVCSGCMRCAVHVLQSEQHFFALALKTLGQTCDNVSLHQVRRIIRFDCEIPFKDGEQRRCLPKNCLILHGKPRVDQGPEPRVHGTIHMFIAPINCNHNDNPLLDSGSQRQFMPAVLQRMKELFKITELPESIDECGKLFRELVLSGKSDLHAGILIATFVVSRYSITGTQLGELKRTAGELGLSDVHKETLTLASKLYFLFSLFGSAGLALSANLRNCGLAACCSSYLGSVDFGDGFFTAFRIAYALQFNEDMASSRDGVRDAAKPFVIGIIQSLAAQEDVTAENAARSLAIHHGLLDEYRKAFDTA